MTLVGWSALEAALGVMLLTALVLIARSRGAIRRQRDAFARQGRIVSEAVRRMAGLVRPEEVKEAAVQVAAELCSPSLREGRRAVFFELDGDTAHVVACADEAGTPPEPSIRVRDHPALAEVVTTGQPVRTAFDPRALGPSARRSIESTGVTHGAAVPILVDHSLKGVLAVGGRGAPVAEFESLIDLGRIVELALTNALVTEALAEQATTDPLTGCANRRGLDLAAHSLSTRHPYSLVAADLDGLKDLNDREGHGAGDRALRHFAEVARDVARTEDVLARVGGDEFLLVLQDTEADGARHFCSRVLDEVARSGVGLRVSLGFASGSDPEAFQSTWQRADHAMYRAKAQGGMRYEPADPPVGATRAR